MATTLFIEKVKKKCNNRNYKLLDKICYRNNFNHYDKLDIKTILVGKMNLSQQKC
jgi:hypothetical protein